jgi:hypothetical protein
MGRNNFKTISTMSNIFCCKNCKKKDYDIVMIKDELWLSIANKEDFLCDICMEKALGKPISKSDFKSPGIPCNEFWKWKKLSLAQQKEVWSEFLKLSPELQKNFRVQLPKQTNHKS